MAHRLVFLAPPGEKPKFGSVCADGKRWKRLFARAGLVRANAYLADGAIRPDEVDADGSFKLPIDERSWHVLLVDDDDEVSATLRMTVLPLDMNRRNGRLPHVAESLARSGEDPWRTRMAVELFLSECSLAHGRVRPEFVVVGGWAASPQTAPPNAGAEVALCTWAFSALSDVAAGICVASERHGAHGQLIRTGAEPIRSIGDDGLYFDPAYGCRVALLGFRVFQVAPSFRRVVNYITKRVSTCEVVVESAGIGWHNAALEAV